MIDTKDNAYPLIELLPPVIVFAIAVFVVLFFCWPFAADDPTPDEDDLWESYLHDHEEYHRWRSEQLGRRDHS